MLTRTSVLALALGVALLATAAPAQAGGKTAHSATSTSVDGAQIKAVQQALKDKGHDPGPIDGVVGPKTRGAVREFQTRHGLTVTGQLDQDTMSKLGVEAKTSRAEDTSSGASASPPTVGTSPSGSGSATESTTELPPRAPDSGAFQNK